MFIAVISGTKYRPLTGLLITAFHDLLLMDNGHILRTLTLRNLSIYTLTHTETQKPSRHPHCVLTLFHLCRRKQQCSGSAVGIRESHLHQVLARLIIRGKRCCPWIQCTTNSGDVYFTALTVHAHNVTLLHATCCHPHDGKTKKADLEKEKHRTQRNSCIEPQGQKKLVRGRQEYK